MDDSSRIDDLRRRVHKDPASIAFAQLAEEYRRAGRWQDAIEACRAGLQVHPGYLSARVTLGRALLQHGDLEAAETELTQVLRAAPGNLAATRALADVQERRGSHEAALQGFRAALSLAPNDPELEQHVLTLSALVAEAQQSQAASHTRRVLAVLEQWQTAIHVARAHPRA